MTEKKKREIELEETWKRSRKIKISLKFKKHSNVFFYWHRVRSTLVGRWKFKVVSYWRGNNGAKHSSLRHRSWNLERSMKLRVRFEKSWRENEVMKIKRDNVIDSSLSAPEIAELCFRIVLLSIHCSEYSYSFIYILYKRYSQKKSASHTTLRS